MNDDIRKRVAEIRTAWVETDGTSGDLDCPAAAEPVEWLCDTLIRTLDESAAAQPLEGDWELRRAREWVKRWGRDPSGTDDLAALLRDCWASGLLDGQAGDDAARAATERAEKAEVQLAGCGAVALDPRQMPDKGAYGWSASLAEVHRVRTDRDEARAEAAALREALVAIRDHRPPPGTRAVQHHVMSIMARDALARFRDLGSE